MSALNLYSSGGGKFRVVPPAGAAADRTVTLPNRTGTFAADGPFVFARASASQSLASSTATKLQLPSEVYDTDNCFDTANHRFTAPFAAQWRLSGVVYGIADTNMTEIEVFLYVNGALSLQLGRWRNASGLSGAANALNFDHVVRLAASEYAEIYVAVAGTNPSVSYLSTRYAYLQVSLERAE